MKKLLITLISAMVFASSAYASTPTTKPVEVKNVCIKVFDSKTKKEVTKCKKMKIHQSYKGTPIPEKKKK